MTYNLDWLKAKYDKAEALCNGIKVATYNFLSQNCSLIRNLKLRTKYEDHTRCSSTKSNKTTVESKQILSS